MGPDTDVLTPPAAASADVGDEIETHTIPWLTGNVDANDHNLRFTDWLFGPEPPT